MSSKINIAFVLKKHFLFTLKNADETKWDWLDVAVFLLLPLVVGVMAYFSKSAGSDNAVGVIITASSVFAGLLLSLLMLVYDQSKNADDKVVELNADDERPRPAESVEHLLQGATSRRNPLVVKYETHRRVLGQLVINISYSIVAALVVIFFSVVSLLATKDMFPVGKFFSGDWSLNLSSVAFALAVMVSTNLLLTVVMIVKRVIRLIEER
ncbi:hypothetical protein NPS34_14535 [Pseudomonas putida]|uniref:Uncharacterized protein n=1 Tax=Pseudomonas putida (strain ATCC 700007 / DSM 6899 / JCM 31910 / BCRC 17059 / LMG 24140 / F1) TaxID=351746 RepID=A5VY86_PSEP1|nr:hypothetical protein [Pseudomonas putida]MDD1999261.1 hypothetical protein [Pseudomonas putida]HDS1790383.1 hypothetical protein [Pseudomonas putida]